MGEVPHACNAFECDVFELHERRAKGEHPLVVDVREDKELAIANIGDVKVMHMSEFEACWQNELCDLKDAEIIFM